MRVIESLVTSGAMLAVGVSLVLSAGCLAVWLVRSPGERRRIGGLTGLALWLYLGVAFVPMQRLSVPSLWQDATPLPTTLPTTLPVLDSQHMTSESMVATPQVASPSAAPQPLAPASGSLPLGAWLAGAFLLVSTGTALWLLVGFLRLRRLLSRCRPAPMWLAAGAPVPILVTASRTRAFCTGVWRPVVVLPADLAVPERAPAARAVLAHELAHVRAADCRVQMSFALLLPLCWWQPLFWWLRERVRFTSELLADDAAARASSVPDYVRELLRLAEAGHARVAHGGALSVFHRPSEFYRRIQMLIVREAPLSRSVSLRRRVTSSLGLLTMVAVAAVFCGVGSAQEPPIGEGGQAAQLQQTVRELRAEVEALRRQLEAGHGEGVIGRLVRSSTLATSRTESVDPVGAQPPGVPDTYVVRKGDSLATIARQQLGDAGAVDRILACNPDLSHRRTALIGQEVVLYDPALRVGQKIVLPPRAASDPADEAAPASEPTPAQPVAPSLGRGAEFVADRSLTDLLNVATRCIELRGAVEIAESELAHLASLGRQDFADRRSILVAEIKLRTLRQQLELSKRLLDAELGSVKGEVERLEKLRAAGLLADDDARLGRATTFLQVLKGFF